MIGIWYSMFCVKYVLVSNIASIISMNDDEMTWLIYESIKIGVVGLSLVIFGISCRWYRYRERDEVVNVQGMIEDIFDKELRQNENEDSSDDDDTFLPTQHSYNTFN